MASKSSKYGGYEEQEFVAELYDPVYGHLRTRDIDFFISYSQKSRGRTLELGCGTGRVLIPTALSSCQITGLDLSPYMLKICRQKLDKQAKEAQERVRLLQGNMTDFETGETYALATIPFRAFQHLVSVVEQKACLDCVNQHLIPNGLLILDLFNPKLDRLVHNSKYMVETEDLPETELADGRKLRRANRTAAFHREQQYNDIELIYYVSHPDGKNERLMQSFSMRYFFRYEVEHLLALCRFRVIDLFGDFDRSQFHSESPEMIFIAEKT